MAVLGTSSGPYAKIWVGKAEGTTHVSEHDLHVVHIAPLYFFEYMPSLYCLTAWVKVPPGIQICLN